MWVPCVFIHEMRVESCVSVCIVECSRPTSLLTLGASWWKHPVFVFLKSPTPPSFISISFFLLSCDCEPAGGLMEDAFLWGTKLILLRRSASLSKADTLLKSYSPHWASQQPRERCWKGLKGMGDAGRLPLSSHCCAVMWEAGVKSFIRSGRRCLQSPR